MRHPTRVLVAAAMAAVLLVPSPAGADQDLAAELAAGVTLLSLSAAGGLVGITGLSVEIAGGERPATAWLATGYVFGTLDTLWGVVILASTKMDGSPNPWGLGIGFGALAIGATNLGLAIGGALLPEPAANVLVAPALLPTPSGDLAPGLALTMTRF